jgi:hypothetical protein
VEWRVFGEERSGSDGWLLLEGDGTGFIVALVELLMLGYQRLLDDDEWDIMSGFHRTTPRPTDVQSW